MFAAIAVVFVCVCLQQLGLCLCVCVCSNWGCFFGVFAAIEIGCFFVCMFAAVEVFFVCLQQLRQFFLCVFAAVEVVCALCVCGN